MTQLIREVEGLMYVLVEDDETYEDAWRNLLNYGTSIMVASYDDIPHGHKAFSFVVSVEYEPQDDDDLCEFAVPCDGPLLIDYNDCTVTGTRDALLLLARNIHDTLEGEDDEHVSG